MALIEFIAALTANEFLRNAMLAGILASVACGVVGSYVVSKRITYIAGSISHCVLGGIGAAAYFQAVLGWTSFDPLYGAIGAALLSALIIGWVSLKAKQREDTAIGAVWAVGMAVGVLFIASTPGYTDLMSYLFGNILLVSPEDLWRIAGLDMILVSVSLLFYRPMLAVCFDEEFARLRGLPVELLYLSLLCLTALTVVLLTMVVGIVMVIALITLPAAVAGRFSKKLWQMMALSTLLCMLFTTGGIALSYGPNLPTGATIIVIAGAAYMAVALGSAVAGRMKRRG